MRIAVGGLWHETNTFAKELTTWDDFVYDQSSGQEIIDRYRGTRTSLGGVIDSADRHGWELVPLFYAAATPSGTVEQRTYEHLRDRFLEQLQSATPVDGCVMALHGAMVAQNCDDPEGELLSRVRNTVGSSVPLVATIDLHANLTETMIGASDVMIGYDTYPHVDAYERAVDACNILEAVLRKQVAPISVLKRTELLLVPQAMETDAGPMKALVDMATSFETHERVLNVSVVGGFPYADVSFAGLSFLVTTDNDQALAAQIANELYEWAWNHRGEFRIENTTPKTAVQMAAQSAADGTTVLVDVADNIGGGSPGDGTVLLREILLQKVLDALVILADPEAVKVCVGLGPGAVVSLDVGGKWDQLHGEPVPVTGTIRLLSDGEFVTIGSYMTGQKFFMGRTAVLRCDSVTLVLTERKTPPWDLNQLYSLGLNPTQFRCIVAKAAIAWRAAYGGLTHHAIYVNTPGICSADLGVFKYRKLPQSVQFSVQRNVNHATY